MPWSVKSVHLFTLSSSKKDGPSPTVSSSEEEATEERTPHPSDTSFGFSSLASRVEGLDDFVTLRPADEAYLSAARRFIASQPVFKKKLKIRVTRRLHVVIRSRQGYTQLRRELLRRRPRPAFSLERSSEKRPSLSAAFAQLSLRPEKRFKRNETVV